MNPLEILQKYYDPHSKGFSILYQHSQAVADLALIIAEHSQITDVDVRFIRDAALLHDIGVFLCDAPKIDCHGSENYMRHGILGRALLEKEGLHKHALVCERHIGVGLSVEDIQNQNLPLPLRDMNPVSHEEIFITLADLFSSKMHPESYKPFTQVEKNVLKYGKDKLDVFNRWKAQYHFDDLKILIERQK